MDARRSFAAALGVLAASLAAPSGAGTLVSPPVLLLDASVLVTCNATNSHKKELEVTIQVIDDDGNTQASNVSLIAPGATRAWSLAGPGVYGCRFDFKGGDRRVAGTLYLMDPALPNPILQVIEAR